MVRLRLPMQISPDSWPGWLIGVVGGTVLQLIVPSLLRSGRLLWAKLRASYKQYLISTLTKRRDRLRDFSMETHNETVRSLIVRACTAGMCLITFLVGAGAMMLALLSRQRLRAVIAGQVIHDPELSLLVIGFLVCYVSFSAFMWMCFSMLVGSALLTAEGRKKPIQTIERRLSKLGNLS